MSTKPSKDTTDFAVAKSEEEWRRELDPTRYSILREAAT